MGLTAIFERNKPGIGPIVFDASFRESHSVQNQVTDEPIEDGAEVAVFIKTMPRSVVMTVAQSSTPDQLVPTLNRTRHVDAWIALRDMALRHDVVDVVTTLENYSRMVVLRCGTVRTKERTNALDFEVELKQISLSRVDQAASLAAFIRGRGLDTEDADLQSTIDIVR